jgi:lysosomal acid lipase/cholesteryl ester hydrolase
MKLKYKSFRHFDLGKAIFFQDFINKNGNFDFFAQTNLVDYASKIQKMMCSPSAGVCESGMSLICGQNVGEVQLDSRILPDYMKHIAHAISIKQVNHYFQLFTSGKFRQYDYQARNHVKYNSTLPPDYNLQNVKAPVYMYSGGCDAIVSEIDIQNLRERLPNIKKYKSFRNFNHCDFNYGKYTRSILYEDILRWIDSERRNN